MLGKFKKKNQIRGPSGDGVAKCRMEGCTSENRGTGSPPACCLREENNLKGGQTKNTNDKKKGGKKNNWGIFAKDGPQNGKEGAGEQQKKNRENKTNWEGEKG